MHRFSLFIIWTLCFVSCKKDTPKDQIQHLNGYWEIKKVILPNGSEKDYNFSQSIDFIEITNYTGIRKKVQPRLDGSFITNNDSESFILIIDEDSLRLHYKTTLSTWKETIISAKENHITIKNEAGNVYFYERYKKIEF
ncbi:lipocalin family protein [Aquimarina muelleri]|uniref:Lipocalin-like domain-containing protein n=1 Tax=Aquimarina muelleri TaxID=279356 RepID=A0A918N4S4_9FLAO|nr:lipocalin family protein [Aquimarina muelleri]MCX2761799.1 class I SAM-dependent methyltransferase [Aquimarina muelleri]GGX23303.1 hypothetical protein GCM10007384_25640 [Aquimarina muelleri]